MTESDGDVLVFDPSRVPDGIRLTDDPILRARSGAYSVSISATDRLAHLSPRVSRPELARRRSRHRRRGPTVDSTFSAETQKRSSTSLNDWPRRATTCPRPVMTTRCVFGPRWSAMASLQSSSVSL